MRSHKRTNARWISLGVSLAAERPPQRQSPCAKAAARGSCSTAGETARTGYSREALGDSAQSPAAGAGADAPRGAGAARREVGRGGVPVRGGGAGGWEFKEGAPFGAGRRVRHRGGCGAGGVEGRGGGGALRLAGACGRGRGVRRRGGDGERGTVRRRRRRKERVREEQERGAKGDEYGENGRLYYSTVHSRSLVSVPPWYALRRQASAECRARRGVQAVG